MLQGQQWYFNTYEQDKFRAQLSWLWKKSVITSGPDLIKNSEYFETSEFELSRFYWFDKVLGVKAVLSRCVVFAYRVHLRAHVHIFVVSAEFVITCYLF